MSNSKQIESTHFHNFKIMKIEKDILHVINSKGEHLTIPFIENPMANEDISESYTIDDEWYRTHGYVSKEEHQKHIKGNNGHKSKIEDIHFTKITSYVSYEEVNNQFVNYKVVKIDPSFGSHLMGYNDANQIPESIEYSLDVHGVKEEVQKIYSLADWQLEISTESDNFEIYLIIPCIDDNIEDITHSMLLFGYYRTKQFDKFSLYGLDFVKMRYKSLHANNLTNQIKESVYILHITPTYNVESIKQNGFVPQLRNDTSECLPRVYFFRSELRQQEIYSLAKNLCNTNKDKRNNHNYTIFTIDVSKIKGKLRFMPDADCEYSIFTHASISSDCIIAETNIQF